MLELFQVPLSEIPFPNLTAEESQRIASIAKEITKRKNEKKTIDTSDLEREIDIILCLVFDLSEKEKELVFNFRGDENG